MIYQNLWNAAKVVLWGNIYHFANIYMHTTKKESLKVNDIGLQLKKKTAN